MGAIGNHLIWTIGILIATAIGIVFFYFANPADCPPCPLHALTGLNCPGCGATRAAHELAHGHVRTALHLNALFVLAIPALGIAGIWRKINSKTAARFGWCLLGLVIIFGIIRNIPVKPFTYLAP